ncbi:phosphoribosylformylglycinamidine synthase subunit PurS [candidate division KSB1 bacterium]|nr:phosphoribosylformylglycinamidine synthase subunit PurS [candidate division KSB1 bacterium]
MSFESLSEEHARALAEEACQKLLANPVIENYSVSFE